MKEVGYIEVTPEQAKDPQKFIKLLKGVGDQGFLYIEYVAMGTKGGVLIVERRPGMPSMASHLCNI